LRQATVSVVIPALNEAESLPYVLSRIPSDVHEVILVDGASTDGTVDVARKAMPTIRVVQQSGRGKGAALRGGFEAATGDIIVHLDADGSTDPVEIPSFVGALLAGADYAKGTRFIQGASTSDITRLRHLGNWAFVVLANMLFGTRFSDITYGYNAVWRVHRDKLALEIDGWANEIVGNIRAVRHGLRVVEVASREEQRIAGEAKLRTFPAGWTILSAIVAERFRPLAAVSAVTMSTAQPARAAVTMSTAQPTRAAESAPTPAAMVAVPIVLERAPLLLADMASEEFALREDLSQTMAAPN
jgi:glycosyltransferase involved in cell wall biosynthesis